MDVLLIGGTGLISTAITRQLVAAGHDVTLFNRGETDADVPALETIRGDRDDPDFASKLAATAGFDCVIDMVCFTEAQATAAVEAYDGLTDQVIFCSTVDVYHRPARSLPIREDAPRFPNVSDYGREKARCEDVFLEAHEAGRFDVTIVRPWATYGGAGGINHTFGRGTYVLDRIRRGQPIVVHGDGTSLWGSCHREDVARAFVNAVGNDDAVGEAYHVTSEETMTWNQYYRTLARVMDAPEPEFVHVPTDVLLEVDPERTGMLADHFQYSTVFDNSKARADLDFAYTISWEEGARRTIERLEEGEGIDPSESVPFDDRLIEAWEGARSSLLESLGD